MPKPIPTLGYPSRTAAALALSAEGASPSEIGARLGVTTSAAHWLLSSGQRRKEARVVTLDTETLDALAPAATARGMRPEQLARLVVETVAEHGLVDAVLDDRA